MASAAKAIAPSMLQENTTAHSRAVSTKCRRSLRMQRHRIQRVLGEELSPSDDDRYKTDGINHIGDELVAGCRPQRGQRGGDAQPGQTHGEAAGESGKGQRVRRTAQLIVGVVLDLLENFGCGAPQGVGSSCHSCVPVPRLDAQTSSAAEPKPRQTSRPAKLF